MTAEALSVYRKYNLLQSDKGGLITLPDFVTNDAQKAAHYYFCRSSRLLYKRVITAKGIGYYQPPALNCRPERPSSQ